MSAYNIEWDKTGERRYEVGVDRGVLYPEKATAAVDITAGMTYKGGVAWNGLTSVTESPSGAEANDIYADNIKYATLRSAETLGGTIEAYMYPDEFSACNGEATPDGLTGVYVGQQIRKPFGFCYRSDVGNDSESSIDTETNYKLHLWWNCTASPSERQYQTINESPDAMTMSWEISTTPVTMSTAGMKPTASMTIDTSKLVGGVENPKFVALLEVLYGTVDGSTITPGYLPTPDKVIELLTP